MLEKILAALDGKEKYPEDLARELKDLFIQESFIFFGKILDL